MQVPRSISPVGLLLVLLHVCQVTSTKLHRATSAPKLLPTFAEFIQKYGRTYQGEADEHKLREALYARRVAKAERQNAVPGRLWTAGVNSHWDRTDKELERLHGSSQADTEEVGRPASLLARNVTAAVRRNVTAAEDVQNKSRNILPDVVTAGFRQLPEAQSWEHLTVWDKTIHNQGNCGSCWAVAASTLLMAHSEIHSSKPRTFAAQDIVSCAPNPDKCGGTGGCGGGTMGLAMEWVLKNGCAEIHEQPYESGWQGTAGTCARSSSMPSPLAFTTAGKDEASPMLSENRRLRQWGKSNEKKMVASPAQEKKEYEIRDGSTFGMTGWDKLPENKYEPLMQALVERGPVGVSVVASDWVQYSSGIFDGCHGTVTSHAVVLMAYGEESGTKYWKAQNTWGEDWGEGGRIRIMRRSGAEDEAACAINNQPDVGTGCEGGPAAVTICGPCGMLYSPVLPHFA